MRSGIKALTFVEVIVTMALLLLFVALAYPFFYGIAKGYATHQTANAALESRLALTTRLAALARQVSLPYWENPDTVFVAQGTSWTVRYWQGDPDKTLVLAQESPGRLKVSTADGTLLFDHLPPLTVDWWKKDGRIVGWQVIWPEAKPFHIAWGSFIW
jgi:Tfp pilus assembly protein FimT